MVDIVLPVLPLEVDRFELELLLEEAFETLELPLEELEALDDELEVLGLEAMLLELV